MKFHSPNVIVSLLKKGGRGSIVRLLLSEDFLLYFLRMASVINPELHFYQPCTSINLALLSTLHFDQPCTHPLFTDTIIKEQRI